MRHSGGLAVIKEAMANFAKKHVEHIQAYDPNGGEDNKRRLTGAHETARLGKSRTHIFWSTSAYFHL